MPNRAAVRLSRVSASMLVVLAAGGIAPTARAQNWDENPPVIMQWFECPWQDMERRMPDWFLAGYGAVWLPPVSRGYMPPTQSNQNSTSAGYDVFDRFDLGKPGAQTAYGTEQGFDAVVEEFHRASGLVYVDMVLNHNAARQGSAGFQADGGYPGFWMAPANPPVDKTPSSYWGDFHSGNGSAYWQSENPNGSNYCLHAGDLVALIDIDHATNNVFIRQPVESDPLNIPGGTYFNKINPANRRFYPDAALGTDTVNNPGMSTTAGPLTSSPFGPFPCNVPARNEPPVNLTFGRFNLNDPTAGDPVPENAAAYLLRWTQWMLDVHKVDGFRIDAIKHMPSWFYDTYYDAVVSNRRVTPDGRHVTPYSFGECVEGNDFTFDRYVRKPNGRASGRSGDAFGNRDVLDLSGAGAVRDLINGGQSWGGVQGAHIDNTDDGFNNGSVGVNHIFSHDNGSTGDGSSTPPLPTAKQQGWFAHAYLIMKPGQVKLYHNARGIPLRTTTGVGGFYPREGLPVAMGYENNATPNPVITNLVQLSNWFGRGYYFPRWTDNEVQIYERSTDTGSGFSGNVLVGCNRSYAGLGITSFDERTFNTNFPSGTRLVELTGNAARADVDPLNQIPEVITVGSGGSVTIRVPRNQNINGVEHNRGFVVYGPAVPAGTVSFTNIASTIPADASGQAVRRRMTPIPVITTSTFEVRLTTTNGDPGVGNNNNADDNAVFRFNQGYQDLNGNGGVDIPYTNLVVPGYENFVTQKTPLAGTSNTNGIYRQVIDATQLPEGVNYVSVVAFRKRNASDAPLFREFRSVVYIDRLCPQVTLEPMATITSSQATFVFRATDRTPNRVQMYVNPVVDVLTAATNNPSQNLATRPDRLLFQRTTASLQHGYNTIAVAVFEESGRGCVQTFSVFARICPTDLDDGNGTGTPDGGIDVNDLLYFLAKFEAGDPAADLDDDGDPAVGHPDGGTDVNDLLFFLARFEAGC